MLSIVGGVDDPGCLEPCSVSPIRVNPLPATPEAVGKAGLQEISTFPRNLTPNFWLYISERLEMTSQNEESKKAKTRK